MNGSPALDTDVLIIGGGPVGMTLAMDLATHGVKSIVIEARRDLAPNPRCNTTNARSMEFFRRLGCADAVRAAGLPADNNTDVVYMTAMNGHELWRVQRPTPAQWRNNSPQGLSSDWPTPEPQHFISQLYMEPVLRKHAVELHGIDLRLGIELLSFQQDEHGVEARVRDVKTGETQSLRGLYMVGADGGASIVRRDIGARLEGISKVGETCTVFLRSTRLTEIYREHQGWMYRFLGGAILVAINGVDEWLFHSHPTPGVSVEDFDYEPQLFAAVGEKFEYEVININRWAARAMVCNKYREGRVLLAGDAAHIWIPMGGFGMNSGVGDAMSIGWRLAGVLQGWLDEKILDTYEIERVPIGERVATQAVKWGRDLFPLMRPTPERHQQLLQSAVARTEFGNHIRDINLSEWKSVGMMLGYYYTDSPVIIDDGTEPPPFDLSDYRETSWPGVRAPHLWLGVDASGKKIALQDKLGRGFCLLRIGSDAPSGTALIDAARTRNLPFTVLELTSDDAIKKYQAYGLVLVRPDQHIVWRSISEPIDADAILDRITGKLIAEKTVVSYIAEPLPAEMTLPNGLRFRHEKLIFSDMTGKRVLSYDIKTQTQSVLHHVEQQTNRLGYLPDGRLLVAAMFDAKLYVEDAGKLTVYADLGALAGGYLSDMVIDRSGCVYVGDTGARALHDDKPTPGKIIRVDTERRASVVMEGLSVPKGLAISPDGNTIFIAETVANRVLQARIELDGKLRPARTFIALDESKGGCEAMTIDRQGGLWLCLPKAQLVEHYNKAGHSIGTVTIAEGYPIACALGADEAALYIVGVSNLEATLPVIEAKAKEQTRGLLLKVNLA